MKKKEKRKYNRSGKYAKKPSDNVQSNSKPIEGQSNVRILGKDEPDIDGQKVVSFDLSKIPEDAIITNTTLTIPTKFTFKDLPLSTRVRVESQLAYRKTLKLFDDSVERKQRAINYFRKNLLTKTT